MKWAGEPFFSGNSWVKANTYRTGVCRTWNSSQKQGALFCSRPSDPLLHFQIQCFLTPARLIPGSCHWTTWAATWSHRHQRVVSCLDLTKIERSTSSSSRLPTPAGERPRPRKHAVIVYFGGRDALTNLCRSLFWTETNIKAGGGGVHCLSRVLSRNIFQNRVSKVHVCETNSSLSE